MLLLFGGENPWLTVEQIAEQVEVSVPSAYRFLALLREMELVEENGDGTYSLTPLVFTLARSAERSFEIGEVLRPVLHDLSAVTGEAALVIRRVGEHAVCAEMIQTEHTIRLSFVPGQIMPLARGAGPKLLLASMGTAWADQHLRRSGTASVDHETLLSELEIIAERGWSVSSAEVDQGVWAAAAPIVSGSRTLAALSVAGPRYRIDEDREEEILHHVVEQAELASKRLAEIGFVHQRKPVGKEAHEHRSPVVRR